MVKIFPDVLTPLNKKMIRMFLQIETLEEHFEICSMVGTISKDGTHLHTTLSRNDGSTVGGHVISDMIVFT